MAIGNLEVINVGLQNESTGSDSLYLAFNKAKNNFAILANTASQYTTFNGDTGINVSANATTGVVNFTNTGVTSVVAGTGISINQSNGAVTITNTGGNGNGAGVTSIGISTSTLSVSNSPIVSAGNIVLNLSNTGITPGQYTNPTVTVDGYGRVTNISNNTVSGTVTSVGITPGSGISVTNSPITTTGNITVTNTGVTRINAGSGIAVTSGNGNVTISALPVTAVLPTDILAAGNLGYTTGTGGTVTQGTSRTTGVTLNKTCGAITLYSDAGTSSYTTFTVTNSVVLATDVIIVNQKSGTDKYLTFVSNVSNGSFSITFSDVSGTTTEQPVFNFAVIRAVAA